MRFFISNFRFLFGDRFQLFIFLTILSIMVVGLYWVGSRYFPISGLLDQRTKNFPRVADQISAVTLGGSHCRAIDFSGLGVSGYHLWSSGQDIVESSILYARFVQPMKNIRFVLIPVPFVLFDVDNALCNRKTNRRSIYYYTKMQKNAPSLDDAVISYLLPLIRPDHWKALLRPHEVPELAVDGRWLNQEFELMNEKYFSEEEAKKRAFHQQFLANLTRTKNPTIQIEIVARVEMLAFQAAKANQHLFFFTPPYYHRYLTAMSSDQKLSTKRLIRQVVANHPNTAYYDYSEDPSFIYDETMFYDVDHMNSKGARAFSPLLRTAINIYMDRQHRDGFSSIK